MYAFGRESENSASSPNTLLSYAMVVSEELWRESRYKGVVILEKKQPEVTGSTEKHLLKDGSDQSTRVSVDRYVRSRQLP